MLRTANPEKQLLCHSCYDTTKQVHVVLASCLADTRQQHRKLGCYSTQCES